MDMQTDASMEGNPPYVYPLLKKQLYSGKTSQTFCS